jgi:hypothetical protein
VALPLEKLGTTYPLRTARIETEAYEGTSATSTVEGATGHVFEAPSHGAVVVDDGLAEVA